MKSTPQTFQKSVKIAKSFEKRLGNGIDPVILVVLCIRRVVYIFDSLERNSFVHFRE